MTREIFWVCVLLLNVTCGESAGKATCEDTTTEITYDQFQKNRAHRFLGMGIAVVNKAARYYFDNYEHCGYANHSDFFVHEHRCDNIPAYPPCKRVDYKTATFPDCCTVECPRHFTALDALLYTISLVKTRGNDPFLQGTVHPNIIIQKYCFSTEMLTGSFMSPYALTSPVGLDVVLMYWCLFLLLSIPVLGGVGFGCFAFGSKVTFESEYDYFF